MIKNTVIKLIAKDGSIARLEVSNEYHIEIEYNYDTDSKDIWTDFHPFLIK